MIEVLAGYLTDLGLWLIVILISIFGVTEHLAVYYAARREGDAALSRFSSLTPAQKTSLEKQFNRWGSLCLAIASIPVLGLVLTTIAGVGGVGQLKDVILGGFVKFQYQVVSLAQ